MNIEDSIEILKNSKKLYLKEKIDSDILEEAIETLLTAYEKEKEKNKELKKNKEETKNKLVRYIAIKEGKDFEQVCREFEI